MNNSWPRHERTRCLNCWPSIRHLNTMIGLHHFYDSRPSRSHAYRDLQGARRGPRLRLKLRPGIRGPASNLFSTPDALTLTPAGSPFSTSSFIVKLTPRTSFLCLLSSFKPHTASATMDPPPSSYESLDLPSLKLLHHPPNTTQTIFRQLHSP